MTCEKGDFAEYAQIRRSLSEREGDLSRARATSRRAEAARSLSLLRPGDIIRVPGGRRAGMAVVLQPGLHPARGSDGAAGRQGHGGHQGRRDHGHPGNGRVDGGRQADGRGFTDFAGPGPLVLTEARQVKRLAVADFPVPAEVIDKIRIAAAPQGSRGHDAEPAGEPRLYRPGEGQAADAGGRLGARR
jgi:ATP-dependent RNA helicase HelY